MFLTFNQRQHPIMGGVLNNVVIHEIKQQDLTLIKRPPIKSTFVVYKQYPLSEKQKLLAVSG